MNDRIEILLDKINMSPSLFADAIGVQRATISHILSGRNNPSLDFVQKVLSRYPKLNPDWILSGRGEMWRTDLKTDIRDDFPDIQNTKSQPPQSKLFDLVSERMEEKADNIEITELAASQIDKAQNQSGQPKSKTDRIKHMQASLKPCSKEITRVIVLYSDHTFESFTTISLSEPFDR